MHTLVNVPEMLWVVVAYLVPNDYRWRLFLQKAVTGGPETRDDFLLAGRRAWKNRCNRNNFATYLGGGT